MAKSKSVDTAIDVKPVTKKASKAKVKPIVLTEKVGVAVIEDVIKEDSISAKKELEVDERVRQVEEVVEKLTPKEPNIKQSETVSSKSEVANVTLPVEEKQLPVSKQTPVKQSASNYPQAKYNNNAKASGPHKSSKELPPAAGQYPEHMVAIALIIKNNAEIRRFTALGILNYLLQKGEIKGDKRYVSFKWNKFTVKFDNLVRDYSYNEPFFINCLVASFASFAASAQKTINNFTYEEMNKSVGEIVTDDDVEAIVASNERR